MTDAAGTADVALADIPRLLARVAAEHRRHRDAASRAHARRRCAARWERAWTFAELDSSTAEVAQRLAAAGVRPGDRVLVVGENCAALVALLFGITRLDSSAGARQCAAFRARDRCHPRPLHASQDCLSCPCFARAAGPRGTAQRFRVVHRLRDGRSPDERAGPRMPAGAGRLRPAAQVAALIYTSGTDGRSRRV